MSDEQRTEHAVPSITGHNAGSVLGCDDVISPISDAWEADRHGGGHPSA